MTSSGSILADYNGGKNDCDQTPVAVKKFSVVTADGTIAQERVYAPNM
jgi:hypothetical protein